MSETETPKIEKTHTVLDSSNIAGIIADARGEPKEEVKPKAEAKPEVEDDSEDEDGVPSKLKTNPEFTDAVRKTIGKKHRAMKESEEATALIYKEKRLAETALEEAHREINRLKAQNKPPEEKTEAPKRENFKTDDEYQDAKLDYRVKQERKTWENEQAEKARTDRAREIAIEANKRIEKARTLQPDFDEVMEKAGEIAIPQLIVDYAAESDMNAELAYHLATHKEVVEKLNKMTPARMLVEIGKIESTLKPFSREKVETAKEETPEPSQDGEEPSSNGSTPSKARVKPITPLNQSSQAVEKKPEEMTGREIIAKHYPNLRARKRH